MDKQEGLNQKQATEMAVYYSGQALTREIPENILGDVRAGFTRFEVDYSADGTVTVMVPREELEVSKKLKSDIQRLLHEIGEKNGALAWKLARRYRV